VDRLDEAWNRLMWQHYYPPKDSVAALASLHAFVNEHRDNTITVGDEKVPEYPYIVACLDGMVDRTRRTNDAGWLRKYTKAVEFAKAGKTRKLDLTARSLAAWGQLRESLGRAPGRKEVVARVEKEIAVKFTLRQWQRVFDSLAELFK
jgi:hypothetical protein